MAINGTSGRRRRKREKEEDPVSKNQVQPERAQFERAGAGRDERTYPYRETKLSGANRDRGKVILPFEVTTSRIDNHTWLIYIVLKVLTIRTCMHKRLCLHAQRVVDRRPILQCSCTVIVLCANVLSASAVPN